MRDLAEALSKAPYPKFHADGLHLLALHALAINKRDKAVAYFQDELKEKIDSNRAADAHTGLGISYALDRSYDRAIREYTQAIELDSRAVNAIINRGTAYYSSGYFKNAVADFDTALTF